MSNRPCCGINEYCLQWDIDLAGMCIVGGVLRGVLQSRRWSSSLEREKYFFKEEEKEENTREEIAKSL